MQIKKDRTEQRGIFTIRDIRYDGGFAEISVYTPEVVPGAGPILQGMISRQSGKSCKFVGYTRTRNRVAKHIKRDVALNLTLAEILSDMRRDGSIKFYEAA